MDNGFTFEYIQTRRLLVSLQLSKQAKQLETLRRQKMGVKYIIVYLCDTFHIFMERIVYNYRITLLYIQS